MYSALSYSVPGQIHGIVFVDKNQNGVLDKGEVGIQNRVGIIKGTCAAQKKNEIDTNPDGTFLFQDLTPGSYCVSITGNPTMFSKLEVDVNLTGGGDAFVSFATGQ